MKLATVIKSIAVAVVLSSGALVSTASHASVTLKCDQGFSLQQQPGTFTFDCTRKVTTPLEVRAGACPFGTINYTAIAGRDFCVGVGGNRVSAVPAAVLDPQNWRVDMDKIGVQDRFLKGGETLTEHRDPHF